MTNIFTEQCQNSNGIAHFFLAEKRSIPLDFVTFANFYKFPESNFREIDGDLLPLFDTFYAIPESLKFEYNFRQSIGGMLYNYRLTGITPKNSIESVEAFYNLVGKKFHIQFRDGNGSVFYLGNRDVGMTFSIKGDIDSSTNQLSFQFSGVFKEKPFVIA